MTITTGYDHVLRPITLTDALAQPETDDLFIEPSGHPKITIQTTLEIEGFTLNITLNDTSISDALAILRRQARGAPKPRQPYRPKRQPKPRYQAIWSDFDFDDAPDADPRGAAVVATATQLLELGKASCWSNALDLARQAITQETRQ